MPSCIAHRYSSREDSLTVSSMSRPTPAPWFDAIHMQVADLEDASTKAAPAQQSAHRAESLNKRKAC